MDCAQLVDILNRGEDSQRQFKENFASIDNLAVIKPGSKWISSMIK